MNNTFLLFQSSKPGMNFNRENRLQRRSKNILRRITMGIGPIWGINSVSPFILSCFKISKIVFYKSLSFGFITYNIMFLTGNIWRRSGQQLHWWHSNWRLLFESRVMFLWWVLNNCTSVTYFKHRQTTAVRVAVVVNEHPYFVYLINTDSIKSKCLHKNSSIGRWKKKNTTTKWPS